MASDEWCKVSGKWYVFKTNGIMFTDWHSYNAKYYHLNPVGGGPLGSMDTNKWIGKYHVNAQGVWDRTAK